ncbi:MAG: 5-formyltetrahydrofolate cyclo-ligase [Candidatus Binatia bacterium]|nr:5-formyltetrahydrofolate cyclo-ligase [Candidatus Binatia bacterium]
MEAGDDARTTKRRLRSNLRKARRAFSPELQTRAADALARHAGADPLAQTRSVVGYLANDGELDIAPLMDRLRRSGAQILLPRCREDGMLELIAVEPGSRLLESGPGGLLEPAGDAVALDKIDLPATLITPAVALDRKGNRLGRGGGSYDRLIHHLRNHGWQVLGICHADHVVAALPTEPHDAEVDAMLTERGLVRPEAHAASSGRRS